MGKIKIFNVLLLCSIILFCTPIKGAVIPATDTSDCCDKIVDASAVVDIRSQVINIAASQIGVKERTGNNDGAEVMEYQHSTGNNQGDQWCASFVAWCLKKAGLKQTGSAYSPSWFTKEKTIYKPSASLLNHPEAGDVFGVWVQSKGRVGHVGIIVNWDDEFVTTIEGNYSDAVVKQKRIRKQIYVASDWISNQSTF